jgi:3-phytase
MFQKSLTHALPFVALLMTGCMSVPAASPLPTVQVTAIGETVGVGTLNDDAADDPAIWFNARNPAGSLIVGTDKKAGLYVYDMSGQIAHFLDAGRVNNVDLLDNVELPGSNGAMRKGILVVASDRNDPVAAKLALFELNPETRQLTALNKLDAGPGEAYGVCLGRRGGKVVAYSIIKDGSVMEMTLRTTTQGVEGDTGRSWKLATQSEGCVVDDFRQSLEVAEEDVGLWRIDLSGSQAKSPVKIASADGREIVADAEGVALADEGQGRGYIVVSSQGDNAYAVYTRAEGRYVGRFRIGAGRLEATEETDGIELKLGNFGADYPEGLFIAQDGVTQSGAQNFKLVSWRDIRMALGLPKAGEIEEMP